MKEFILSAAFKAFNWFTGLFRRNKRPQSLIERLIETGDNCNISGIYIFIFPQTGLNS